MIAMSNAAHPLTACLAIGDPMTKNNSSQISRRGFLVTAGALSGLAVCNFGGRDSLAKDPRDRVWTENVESWTPSTCNLCPSGCGILVRVVDKRAVRIEGNPHHPINQGSLCPKGHAMLQKVYHQRRLHSPLANGSPVSWEDASSAIGGAIDNAISANHKVMVIGRTSAGMNRYALRHFAAQFGAIAALSEHGGLGLTHAHLITQGIDNLVAYDIENTDCLLSFSSGLLDNWWSPITGQRAIGHLRRGRGDASAKIIEIGPRLSRTGSRADEWIPVNPGTEGVFALGIAYVLIKEGLYDDAFVTQSCSGFDGDNNFLDTILHEFRPERVASWTGASVRDILRIAKLYARAERAVAIPGRELTAKVNGTQSAAAVHALNALKGNFESAGGVLLSRTLSAIDDGSVPMNRLPDAGHIGLGGTSSLNLHAIAKTIDSSVKVVFVVEPERLLEEPGGDALEDALDRIGTVVSLTTMTGGYEAKYSLPITTPLEEHGETQGSAAFGFPVVGTSTPAIDPEGARPIATIVADIATAQGTDLGWTDAQDLLRQRMAALFETKQGTILTDPFDTEQIRVLAERGWHLPSHDNAGAFADAVLEKGGWWDPAYTRGEWGRVFRTPDHRFAFPNAMVLNEIHLGKHDEGHDSSYPLMLCGFESLSFSFGWGGESQWLMESATRDAGTIWETWVLMNPHTAHEQGLHNYDKIRVETESGAFIARLRTDEGLLPELVMAPLGLGRKQLRDNGTRRGSSINKALGSQADHTSGEHAYGPTKARIIRLEAAGAGKEAH